VTRQERVRAWAVSTRAAQGLGPKITNVATLDGLAAKMLAPRDTKSPPASVSPRGGPALANSGSPADTLASRRVDAGAPFRGARSESRAQSSCLTNVPDSTATRSHVREGGPRQETGPQNITITASIVPDQAVVATGPRSSWAWRCPRVQVPRPTCAVIAEQSGEVGSVEAAYRKLDLERAAAQTARRARAEAERDRVTETIYQMSRRAEGERRFRQWLATPLEVPEWVTGEGWPEPDENRSGGGR
jgi:hypothetical protein